MLNHIIVTYDSISNEFTYARKHHPSPNNFIPILRCINCGTFIGLDNGTDVEITHEGIKST